jgi:tetratricopeptide (TPR) repeat protein
MKRQNTLKIAFILLIILSFNVKAETLSDKVSACTSALSKGDATLGLSKADEILKLDANSRDGLLCKGRALGMQGKYIEALGALEQADKFSKDNFDHIIANILIGNLHKNNQKNVEAIASYEKSLNLCKVDKNEKFTRINYNLIGEVQTLNKDLNSALASYLAGSKLSLNDNERAESYELLASTYKSLAQYDAAIEYQIKGVQMEKLSGTLDQYANANLELGQIYTVAKDYPNAEKTLSKLVQFCKDNGGAYYEAKANLYLAQSKLASGDTASAKMLLSDAKNIAKSTGADDLTGQIDEVNKKLNIE